VGLAKLRYPGIGIFSRTTDRENYPEEKNLTGFNNEPDSASWEKKENRKWCSSIIVEQG